MGTRRNKSTAVKSTNVFDFLIAFGSGVVNLLKIEKMICIVILYILVRDGIFVSKLSKDVDYRPFLIDTQIIERIFESDNNLIWVMAIVIAVLISVIIIQIMVVNFVYKKEIKRLTDERRELIHNVGAGQFTPIKKHNTSETVSP